MKEYLLLLRAGKPASEKTEAENKTEMAAWGAYMGKLAQGGHMVGGFPVVHGGITIDAHGSHAHPVDSGHGVLGGYLIIKADSLEHAAELAKDCPHITNEGNIEVREIAPMPAM